MMKNASMRVVPAAKFGWVPFGSGSLADDEAFIAVLRSEPALYCGRRIAGLG